MLALDLVGIGEAEVSIDRQWRRVHVARRRQVDMVGAVPPFRRWPLRRHAGRAGRVTTADRTRRRRTTRAVDERLVRGQEPAVIVDVLRGGQPDSLAAGVEAAPPITFGHLLEPDDDRHQGLDPAIERPVQDVLEDRPVVGVLDRARQLE